MPDRMLFGDEVRSELRRRAVAWGILGSILVGLVALILAVAIRADQHYQQERIVARYVLCEELEAIKAAQRQTLTDEIREIRAFIDEGGIPGLVTEAQLVETLQRKIRLRQSLAPYPRGCAAFAHDPSRLNVTVPDAPE